MEQKITIYDIAYGAFLFCGVSALSISIINFIPMGTGTAGVLGLLFAVPVALVLIVMMATGIILTVKLYKHWQLVTLSISSILFIVELVTEAGPSGFYNLVPVIYGLITCVLTFSWFLLRRKKINNA